MLTVIIVSVIAISTIVYSIMKFKDWETPVMGIPLFIAAIIFIVMMPFAGYEEVPITEETKLIPINEGNEGNSYLVITGEDEDTEYIYKSEKANAKYGTSVSLNELSEKSGRDIKVVELKNSNKAVLVKNVYEAKRNLFVIAWDCKKVEYIFFVPEGTIER